MRSSQEYGQIRRTKYDIYADIIGALRRSGACSLTRVSYGANVPLKRAKRDLGFLASHGFVREVELGSSKRYEAAKWGIQYFEAYRHMHKFFAALEEPVTMDIPEIVLPGRVTTGYGDLDNLLYGGIPENCVVALSSASCDERSLLVRRFLDAGAQKGQITLYATMESGNVRPLFEKLQANLYLLICNPQADTMIGSSPNVFKLKGVENLNDVQFVFAAIFSTLDKDPGKTRRACIEIISDVLLQHHAVGTRRWLTGLIPQLKQKGFTTLAVIEPQMHPSEDVHAILGLFEGEISIFEKETGRGLERFLKIKKMCNQRYLDVELPLRKEGLFIDM